MMSNNNFIKRCYLYFLFTMISLSLYLFYTPMVLSSMVLCLIYVLNSLYRENIFNIKIPLNKENILLIMLILAPSFLVIVNLINHGFSIFFLYAMTLIYISFAYIISKDLKFYYEASRFSLIVVFLFIFILAFERIGTFNPLENLIGTSSANGITSYTIILGCNFFIAAYLYKRKVNFTFYVIIFYIAYLGWSRMSIIIAFLMLVVGGLKKCSSFPKAIKLSIAFIIIFSKIFILNTIDVGDVIDSISYSVNTTKMSVGVVDKHRLIIINEYFRNIDWFNAFYGVNIKGTLIDWRYGSNLHNSYLRAHSLFGIFYLSIIVLSIAYVSIKSFTNSLPFYFSAFMFLCILLRGLTEPIIFPHFYDVFIFSLMFIFLRHKNLLKEPLDYEKTQ